MSLIDLSDPVENLLVRIPDPHEDYMSPSKEEFDDFSGRLVSSVELFIQECNPQSLSGPDEVFLYRSFQNLKVGDTWNHAAICDTLSQWAHRSKTPVDSDNSQKARHLRYIEGVTRGRRDSPRDSYCSLLPIPINKSGIVTCASCPNKNQPVKMKDVRLVDTEGTNTIFTYYCSPECQKAHVNEKIRISNFLTQLNRGLSTFDDVLSLLQETVRYQAFKPVEVEADLSRGILKVELPNSDKKNRLIHTGGHIAGKVSYLPRQRHMYLAALANNTAEDVASGASRPLLDLFLDPILALPRRDPLIQHVEIVEFWPKNIKTPIYTFRAKRIPGSGTVLEYSHFNSINRHKVIRISFTNGLQLAIDLSRRQFGWTEYLADWETYAEQRIYKTIDHFAMPRRDPPRPDGLLMKTKLDQYSRDHPVGIPYKVFPDLYDMVVQQLVSFLNSYVEGNYRGMGPFLSIEKENRFQDARKLLIKDVKQKLDVHANNFERLENFRFYLDHRNMTHKVALGEELCRRLEKVWLSEAEYNQTGGNEGELRRLWETKWNQNLGPDYQPGRS
ncbi:hypothetical protein V8F20_004833 [Naviculisporaceae sp. PSN 640]